MTASSTIIIEAQDNASRVLESAANNVQRSVNQIKDVSRNAKASTEFFGTLATTLGGSQLGGYASQLAQMTERVSQFAEVSKAGTAGAFAFKAGIVALVGSIGFGIGKAIGDVTEETEKWNNKLAEAGKEAESLNQKINAANVKEFNKQLAEARLFPDAEQRRKALEDVLKSASKEVDGLSGRLKTARKESEEWQDAWFKFGNRAAFAEQALKEVDVRREALEVAKSNLEVIREELSERTKQSEELAKQAELVKQQEAFIAGLAEKTKQRTDAAINLEVSATQKIEERRIAIEQGTEAARAYALELEGLDQTTARRIASEEAALDAAQKAADIKQATIDKEKEAAKQIADAQKQEIDRLKLKTTELLKGADAAKVMALMQRGLSEDFAKRIVAEENALTRIEQQRDQRKQAAQQLAGVQTGVQAVESRLQTRGRSDSGLDRIARAAERQVKLLENIDQRGQQQQPQANRIRFAEVN